MVWGLPIGKGGFVRNTMDIIRRRLSRHAWQYATIVLAGVILLVVGLLWLHFVSSSSESQIAAVASQLTEVVDELQKDQLIASASGGSATIPQAELTEKLARIQQLLKNTQATVQNTPTSAHEDRPVKQAPSTPKHNSSSQSQIAAVTSQLTEVVEEFQKVQLFASGDSATIPQAELTEKLARIQQLLNNMQATVQNSPGSAHDDRPLKQAPSTPRHE